MTLLISSVNETLTNEGLSGSSHITHRSFPLSHHLRKSHSLGNSFRKLASRPIFFCNEFNSKHYLFLCVEIRR